MCRFELASSPCQAPPGYWDAEELGVERQTPTEVLLGEAERDPTPLQEQGGESGKQD